ncbi:MAG: hypothetical protein QOG84_514 [Sphingomonadales bacterium]|jgi:hypothetical protein|nr:hypothetical protein [Sphingomonadales bacterium]
MIHTYFYGLAAALALAGAAPIAFPFVFRRPVLAHARASELGEMERAYDRDMYLARSGYSLRRTPSPADLPKPVLTRVQYEVGGTAYCADVTLLTPRGDRPDSLPTLWYDPRDPKRVTAVRPAWALGLIAVAGAIAIAGHQLPF